MPRIVSVVFRNGGRRYEFDAGNLELTHGDRVVVDTTRGLDCGLLVKGPDAVAAGSAPRGLKKVIRKATPEDDDAVASHHEAECEAKRACRQLVAELGLDLKVIEARQAFEGGKITLTFFAEERVDFRDLVTKLSERIKRRVELKQVSARDGARIVGGFGPCGRSLCCATFAGDQEPVSIRMAKDQSLPLNPAKISGCCGRLMCCLKYEHPVYVDFRKRAPRRGTVVTTPGGEGKVAELLPSSECVMVEHGEGRTVAYKLADVGRAREEKRMREEEPGGTE